MATKEKSKLKKVKTAFKPNGQSGWRLYQFP